MGLEILGSAKRILFHTILMRMRVVSTNKDKRLNKTKHLSKLKYKNSLLDLEFTHIFFCFLFLH